MFTNWDPKIIQVLGNLDYFFSYVFVFFRKLSETLSQFYKRLNCLGSKLV